MACCMLRLYRSGGPLYHAAARRRLSIGTSAPSRKERLRRRHYQMDGSREKVQDHGGKIVILTGPTAVGKTELALRLAEQLDGEIISADSVQVYRGLDVGSDKIPVPERRGIRHHMIDILDVTDDFSAGAFYEQGRQIADDILRRGKTPIVAGGTGFYLHWFINGKADVPESERQWQEKAMQMIRDAIERNAGGEESSEEERWEAACRLLDELGDTESADRLRGNRNNWYRLRRAVEIVARTGQPMSSMDVDLTRDLDYDFRCFFLFRDRQDLYRRIDRRVEQMFIEGILPECGHLLASGLTAGSHNSTRGIGYRQGMEMLQAVLEESRPISEEDIEDTVRKIWTATHTLVKRQMTWFRGYDLFRWVDNERPWPEVLEEIVANCTEEHVGGNSSDFDMSKEQIKEMRRYDMRFEVLNDPEKMSATVKVANEVLSGLRSQRDARQSEPAVPASDGS
ncbi:unnamed protein product [Pedinophyceae sp. YPF-701]|nr:unnamed protein product [Pedinophyceae sp. YPF-701]